MNVFLAVDEYEGSWYWKLTHGKGASAVILDESKEGFKSKEDCADDAQSIYTNVEVFTIV